MKTTLFLLGATLLCAGAGAQAQGRANSNNRNGGATFPLPEGVESLVSIDAFNILIAQTNRDGVRGLSPIIVRHVYSGGIARLFGGTTVPTEQFVSPGAYGGGQGGSNSGVRGGQNGGGQNGGGQNGGIQNNGGIQSGGQNADFGGVQGGQNGGGQEGGNFGAFQMRPSTRLSTRVAALRRRN